MTMAVASGSNPTASNSSSSGERKFSGKEKPMEVRMSNITAGKAVADVIRTSLGPKGMDKMIKTPKGEVIITNDGATILKHMGVLHPCSKMLVELSAAQDAEAGDGTTSVVVFAGALLSAAEKLLEKGVHPTTISESFQAAAKKSVEILEGMSQPVRLDDRETLLKSASTSLNSKIVAPYASQISSIAVDSVMSVLDPSLPGGVDIKDIRVIPKVGGTIEDMELCDGVLLTQSAAKGAGGPSRIEKAKIALCQFQLSAPKTDMESQIVVTDYQQMDRILKEERTYILNMCKKIKKAGATVLLVQKSILRDAVGELALHYLAKLKIMVITEIERDEVEFICKSLGCRPIADIESFAEDKLATAELVEEVTKDSNCRFIQITGVKATPTTRRTASILCRGNNEQVLAEAERSLHDALCVIRCLTKKPAMICGGGAPETELAVRLGQWSTTLEGMQSMCVDAYARCLETIPTVLAENAGLEPIAIVTELRNRHAAGNSSTGINVRRATVSDMLEEKVVQPLLVSTSAITLATETVSMIMKIDDIVQSR